MQYECPKTGSHFDFQDLHKRLNTLKPKRDQIDDAMRLEDQSKKLQKRHAKAIENFEIYHNMPRGTATIK